MQQKEGIKMPKKKIIKKDWFVDTIIIEKQIECEVGIRYNRGTLQIIVKEAT